MQVYRPHRPIQGKILVISNDSRGVRKEEGYRMFGIGMPELLVIAVIALLVVGPKKLPEIAKALGKGLTEFRKVADSATDTIKETLQTDELKKDMDGLKDSLLYGKDSDKDVPTPPAAADAAKGEVPKPTDGKPQA